MNFWCTEVENQASPASVTYEHECTRPMTTLFLAQPSFGCETNLISHYFSSQGHWSHTGRAVPASSVSLKTFHFFRVLDASVTVLGSLPQSEMCLSFAHKTLLCPGDEFISLLPSLLLNKSNVMDRWCSQCLPMWMHLCWYSLVRWSRVTIPALV